MLLLWVLLKLLFLVLDNLHFNLEVLHVGKEVLFVDFAIWLEELEEIGDAPDGVDVGNHVGSGAVEYFGSEEALGRAVQDPVELVVDLVFLEGEVDQGDLKSLLLSIDEDVLGVDAAVVELVLREELGDLDDLVDDRGQLDLVHLLRLLHELEQGLALEVLEDHEEVLVVLVDSLQVQQIGVLD